MKTLKAIGNAVMDFLLLPAYALDKRGYHAAADFYALAFVTVPLVLVAIVLLIVL